MSDLEQPLLAELERLAPADEIPARAWHDVRRQARRRPARSAVFAVLATAAVAAPTLALSASVRNLVGLGGPPNPDYSRARLAVSAPIPGGRVARVYLAPSKEGGQCSFVVLAPATSTAHPTQMNGGATCTLGQERFGGALAWSFSHGHGRVPIINGRVGTGLHAAGVELRWYGGSQRLAFAHGVFVAAAPGLDRPPFRKLPYELVVIGASGDIVYRSRIPTSFLFEDWKQVQPQLHRYRVAHGCDAVVLWRCRSR